MVNCKSLRILSGYTNKCYLSLLYRFIYSDENDRKYRKTLIKKFVTGVIGVCKGEF